MRDYLQHADVSVWVFSAIRSLRVKTALLPPVGPAQGWQRNPERLAARSVPGALLGEISKRGAMPASPWEEHFTGGAAMTAWFF